MNVLVICVDTFRADIVGEGKKLSELQTPHQVRLASKASSSIGALRRFCRPFRFPDVYSPENGPFPGRFETPNEGLQPNEQGWHPISHEMDTFAERFHDAGFATGLVSDVYHRFKATMNFTRGFVSWRFIRGQENDGYRSGPFSRIGLGEHTREGEADPDPEVIVFDLEADPEEDHQLQDPPIEVVNIARYRAEELLGRLPVRFRHYDQRHTACSMRSFAPSRLDRDRG